MSPSHQHPPRALVHLERCPTYERAAVTAAVRAALGATAGNLLQPGRTVLVKPNLVNPQPAETGICTHPEVVRAVAEVALEAGCQVVVGDQPTYDLSGEAGAVFGRSELSDTLSDLAVEWRLLSAGGYAEREVPAGRRVKAVHVSRLAAEVDVILSVAKCKTHVQTTLTGAVKNMFGAVAPRDRMDIHMFGAYRALGEALADTYAALPADLTIMDAVVSMGGPGPVGGGLVPTGFIAASQDAVALDTILEDLIGLRPGEVAVTKAAAALGLGVGERGRIEVAGADPAGVRRVVARPPTALRSFPPFLGRLARPLIWVRPWVDEARCVRCGACTEVCPAGGVQVGARAAEINADRCVECFCCMEACPERAISPRRSLLTRLAWRR